MTHRLEKAKWPSKTLATCLRSARLALAKNQNFWKIAGNNNHSPIIMDYRLKSLTSWSSSQGQLKISWTQEDSKRRQLTTKTKCRHTRLARVARNRRKVVAQMPCLRRQKKSSDWPIWSLKKQAWCLIKLSWSKSSTSMWVRWSRSCLRIVQSSLNRWLSLALIKNSHSIYSMTHMQ